MCKLPLSLADTRLIVPENNDSDGPKQPQIRLGHGFEINLERKRKASIMHNKKDSNSKPAHPSVQTSGPILPSGILCVLTDYKGET